MVISCSDCVMQHAGVCGDCVVTHVLRGGERAVPNDGLVFDLATERAVRLLPAAGLVPALRHRSAS
ncbi:hypothetical protein BH24ACT5_BH24ACT5_12220 [soil metagenome]